MCNANENPVAFNVETRLKVLAMYFVRDTPSGKLYFVMTGTRMPGIGDADSIQFAPPGGSVNERTAHVLAIDDPVRRSEILADNASREFIEEVVKSTMRLDTTRPSVVGGLRSNADVCAFDRRHLVDALAVINASDVGAYLEVEYRRSGEDRSIRGVRKYFAHDDDAIPAIADGSFSPPHGHELTRILLNVVSVDVRDISGMYDTDAFDKGDESISEGVFVDGEKAGDVEVAHGSRLYKLFRSLRPRVGEIESVHVLSQETLWTETVGPARRYEPWAPIASSIYNKKVIEAVRCAASASASASAPTAGGGMAMENAHGQRLWRRSQGQHDPVTPSWRSRSAPRSCTCTCSCTHTHTHTTDAQTLSTRSLLRTRAVTAVTAVAAVTAVTRGERSRTRSDMDDAWASSKGYISQ